MKCFYHSADLDGHCSGAIVTMLFPECEMIGIDYGDEFPWDAIPIGCSEQILMIDFSLQPFSEMKKLNIYADPLIWIDHHASAIKDHADWVKKGNEEFSGIQRVGVGACQLVWEYFSDNFSLKVVPTFIKLLSEYDVWDHSDPRTLRFQYGMRYQDDTSPNNQEFWKSLFDVEEVHRITEVGDTILRYQLKENEKYSAACAFETALDGLSCIAINKMLANSQLFDSCWDTEKYDAMIAFGWRKGRWVVSLYSDKDDVDVGKIAKQRGGGGHKGAAGFQTDNLPFELR